MFSNPGNPFLAVILPLAGLCLVLAHELQPVGVTRPGLAVVAAFLAVVPPVVTLSRPSQVGCATLTASLALWACARLLERPPLEGVRQFVAPLWVALLWEHAARPLLARRETARAHATDPVLATAPEVAPYLSHPSSDVRDLAARRLGSAFAPVASFPLLRGATQSLDPLERDAAYAALRAMATHPDGRAQVHDLLRERSRDPDEERAA